MPETPEPPSAPFDVAADFVSALRKMVDQPERPSTDAETEAKRQAVDRLEVATGHIIGYVLASVGQIGTAARRASLCLNDMATQLPIRLGNIEDQLNDMAIKLGSHVSVMTARQKEAEQGKGEDYDEINVVFSQDVNKTQFGEIPLYFVGVRDAVGQDAKDIGEWSADGEYENFRIKIPVIRATSISEDGVSIPAKYDRLLDRVRRVADVWKIQGSDGNWNANEYMRGMFNGLELAMSILEDREPVFKDVQPSEVTKRVGEVELTERFGQNGRKDRLDSWSTIPPYPSPIPHATTIQTERGPRWFISVTRAAQVFGRVNRTDRIPQDGGGEWQPFQGRASNDVQGFAYEPAPELVAKLEAEFPGRGPILPKGWVVMDVPAGNRPPWPECYLIRDTVTGELPYWFLALDNVSRVLGFHPAEGTVQPWPLVIRHEDKQSGAQVVWGRLGETPVYGYTLPANLYAPGDV